MLTTLLRLAGAFVCFCLVACSCGGGNGTLSGEDATRAAAPTLIAEWETAWSQKTPEPTPTPIPPLVSIKLTSPGEVNGSGLYVMDIQSGEIMQITGRISLEAWLPDERMLVSGGEDVNPGTYLLDPSNSVAPKRLWDYGVNASPDGRHIAVSRQDAPLSSAVTTFPIDDPDDVHTLHVAGEVDSLTWSADSQWLAMAAENVLALNISLIVVRESNLNDMRDLGDGKVFAWSPTGEQIALASAQRITVFDLASGQSREWPLPPSLSISSTWQDLWHGPPPSASLSPDSRYLAFSSDTTTFVLPVDGEGGVEMTSVHFNDWLADGLLAVSGPMCSKAKRLMLVSVDGAVERIFDDRYIGDALPSPDGRELAAAFLTDVNSSLEIVDAVGANVVLLSTSRGRSRPIAWSSDGGKLAFGSGGDSFVCHQDYTPGDLDIHPIQ